MKQFWNKTLHYIYIFWAVSWEKKIFAYAKTKAQISCTVTAQLISAFVFAARIVHSLFFLNPKFQVSSPFLRLYRQVCVGPGRKSWRPVFSRLGSSYNLFFAAHLLLHEYCYRDFPISCLLLFMAIETIFFLLGNSLHVLLIFPKEICLARSIVSLAADKMAIFLFLTYFFSCTFCVCVCVFFLSF